LAATATVYGCSSDPAPEDLCGWLQNPAGTNCVAEFHEDIGSKCGALDPSLVSGTFSKREALDVCVLSKGGTIVFDPPVEIAKVIPTGMPTTMKITNPDGSACGEITHSETFSWSLKIAAPLPSMTTSSASSSSSAGAGGAEEQSESHYSNGTISMTRVAGQTITVACPAPDVHAGDVLTVAESHTFNLNQSLAATPQNGCPQFAQIIPQASLEIDPGGILRAGSVRLKILFPPEAKESGAGGGGAGGATSSTGTGTVTTLVPETVFYFDCTIPGAPEVCANGIKDASEIDVDCGGPETVPNCPARCAVGQACSGQNPIGDCDCDATSFCGNVGGVLQCVADLSMPPKVKGVCGGIICANQVKDASESDIDCGGVCTPCEDTKKCGENKDCISNSCTLGVCGPPTCDDKATNGTETDVDCGGGCMTKCDDGKKCLVNEDCLHKGCDTVTHLCTPCANGAKDNAETDVDCGGSGTGSCAPCGEMKQCKVDIDCATKVCVGGICSGCSNMKQDGKESAKDCGGPDCSKCVDGKTCMAATDCVSNGCLNGLCSLCGNGFQDPGESDVDCGGTANPSNEVCPRCDNGKVCATTADCKNGTCGATFRCGSCGDGLLDGSESDVDCGGSCAVKCPESKICNLDTDCAQGVCLKMMITTGAGGASDAGPMFAAQGVCNTCTDGIKSGMLETDVDCGGASCPKCLKSKMCKINLDCATGACIAGTCQ
jgi:hypothetical protein